MKKRSPFSKAPAIRFILTAGCLVLCALPASGQGCIAIRGAGQCSLVGNFGSGDDHGYFKAGDWQVSLNYRWAYSDRHFVGDKEFALPSLLDAEAINNSHNTDLAVVYAFSPRWSVGLTLPFTYAERSTKYEHDHVNRYETSAGGIGDVRLTAYYWVFDPAERPKGNISLGIGPKFPTGDYDATDTFYTVAGPRTLAVDPSIQPGDGGFGFAAEMIAFRQLGPRWVGYAQGFYLFNPRNTNGVQLPGGPPGNSPANPLRPFNSVTDQYSGRLGATFALVPEWGLALSLGARVDGVPVEDAIGASDGFRRPGYAISIEPGISWMWKDWSVGVTAPVALYRNRPRSTEDERISALRGTYQAGDAAFPDYFITLSVARRF